MTDETNETTLNDTKALEAFLVMLSDPRSKTILDEQIAVFFEEIKKECSDALFSAEFNDEYARNKKHIEGGIRRTKGRII